MSIQIGSISCYIYTPDQLSSFLIKTSPPHLPSAQLPAKHVKENTDQEIKETLWKSWPFYKN